MTRFIHYTLILLIAVAWAGTGLAQTVQTDSARSEIWMTEAELESLLTRIAVRKKQQLEKERQALLASNPTIQLTPSNAGIISGENNLVLQRQIEALNQQITLLAASGQTRSTTDNHDYQIASIQRAIDVLNRTLTSQYYPSPSGVPPILNIDVHTSESHSATNPTTAIQQSGTRKTTTAERPTLTAQLSGAHDESGLAQRLHASNQLNMELQMQLDDLYEKLDQAARDSTATTMTDDSMRAELAALAEEMAHLRQLAQTVTEERPPAAPTGTPHRNPTIDLYKHSIYFANNSTSISADDIESLRKLYGHLSASTPSAQVVLQGFSSTTGNAQYNVQLSSKRASAVKDALVQMGLDPEKIVTLYHGPDDSKRADLARRVEVTLAAD